MVRKLIRAVALSLSLAVVVGAPALAVGGREDNVTLCHRTASHTNPYVRITVDSAGAFHGHYSHHEGPVFPSTGSDGKWGDIIPSFTYKGQSYSMNWNDQGQAIFNNGCKIAGGQGGETPPPAPTPTPTPTTTPTTGGLGGGQVAGASTQVQAAPAGGVNAGVGGTTVVSAGALVGLAASVGSLGLGLRRLSKNGL
jgi:hypothetical protein